MKKEYQDIITENLGVKPVLINSSLVSAQCRDRLYWCNWNVSQPKDKGIILEDIIDEGIVNRKKSFCICANYHKGTTVKEYFTKNRRQLIFCVGSAKKIKDNKYKNIKQGDRIYDISGKSPTLNANNGNSSGGSVLIYMKSRGNNKGGIRAKNGKTPSLTANSWQENNFLLSIDGYRKLTPVECERLQTLPDNYTSGVSNTQRYKMLGNGFTADVIAHLFLCMSKKIKIEYQQEMF